MATPRMRTKPPSIAAKLAHLPTRLTDRDRQLIRLVHDHRVLTTSQLAQLAFDSRDRAEHRLRELTALEVLDRFRPRLPVGSAPYHYVLGPMGAHVLAAEQGIEVTRLGWRRDKALSIAYSQRLGHTVGVNGFFAALIAYARRSRADAALVAWRSEARCRAEWGHVVRPDGYARWRHGSREIDLFLEYDTGTEPLDRVAGKLPDYDELAYLTNRWTPTLFWLRAPAREANLRAALTTSRHQVPVATGHPVADRSPAEAVWLPLGQHEPRRRLIDLADPQAWQPASSWAVGS